MCQCGLLTQHCTLREKESMKEREKQGERAKEKERERERHRVRETEGGDLPTETSLAEFRLVLTQRVLFQC